MTDWRALSARQRTLWLDRGLSRPTEGPPNWQRTDLGPSQSDRGPFQPDRGPLSPTEDPYGRQRALKIGKGQTGGPSQTDRGPFQPTEGPLSTTEDPQPGRGPSQPDRGPSQTDRGPFRPSYPDRRPSQTDKGPSGLVKNGPEGPLRSTEGRPVRKRVLQSSSVTLEGHLLA